MFFFGKKEMDELAAEAFWQWFAQQEQWIIHTLNTHGMDVVWAIDAQLKPVFPYFKQELEFQLGFHHGKGEFLFFYMEDRNLLADAVKLRDKMPGPLRERWTFTIEA